MQRDSENRELVTEILSESQQASTLNAVVELLGKRGVTEVRAEYGFIPERDLRGEKVPEDCLVPLRELLALIHRGLRDGTIEWGGMSDFHLRPVGLPVTFTLCNDSDLHFSSTDRSLLLDMSRALSTLGIRVYDSGVVLDPDDWR